MKREKSGTNCREQLREIGRKRMDAVKAKTVDMFSHREREIAARITTIRIHVENPSILDVLI